jgi:hypothetical protein
MLRSLLSSPGSRSGASSSRSRLLSYEPFLLKADVFVEYHATDELRAEPAQSPVC